MESGLNHISISYLITLKGIDIVAPLCERSVTVYCPVANDPTGNWNACEP